MNRLRATVFMLWAVTLAHPYVAAARGGLMNDSTELAYGSDPAQQIDLYPAPGAGPHRLVLFIHGGGWVAGNQHPGGRRLAETLNQAGFTLASVGYRLVPETDVAGSVSDVAHAAGYLLSQAGRFNLDPNHFAIMGHSSGAHMAALLGTDQSYLQNAGVNPAHLTTVIALDGVFDVTANLTDYPTDTRREVFGADPALWKRYSPVDHLDGMQAHPEFCLLHEDTVPRFVEQEELFEKALRSHGETVRTEVAPGLKHAQLMSLFDSNEPMAMFTLKCLAEAR
jgi:acetyl esterase/lipase